MIEFCNLSHRYDEKGGYVIKDISFIVEKGSFVGLTGPSGSGKSTLASIAAGHILPSSGKVIVDGKNLTGRPSKEIFLVHQSTDLFPWQTVEKQILFALGKKDFQKVDNLIKLVRLSGYENYYPNQLSGGMQKRLSLARALAVNPKLLILDESFNSLDSKLKIELFQELKKIWGIIMTTILLITHDSEDLEYLVQKEIKLTSQKPSQILELKKR